MAPAFGLYTHIRANKFRSGLLLATLFALVQVAVYGLCLILVSMTGDAYLQVLLYLAFERWLDVVPFTIVGTLVWIAIAYYFNVKIIARMTGSLPVTRRSHPGLYNLLENLCISRGITMPSLQIIETDELNAFASGLNDEQYTITVTEGLLYALDDDELEAVLAHELTHIRNSDVRLMVISVIMVGILSFAAEMAFRSFFMSSGRRSSSSRNGSGGRIWAYLIAIAIIALAVFLSTILKLALSRRREYLADAGAVELTKNPDAMISALRTIEGNSDVEGLSSNMMEMCIDNPRSGMANLFATHPTMDARVEALIQYAGAREFTRDTRRDSNRTRAPGAGSFPLQRPSTSVGSSGTSGPWSEANTTVADTTEANTLPASNWNSTPVPMPIPTPATPAGMLATAAVLAGATAQAPPPAAAPEKPAAKAAPSSPPVSPPASGPWARQEAPAIPANPTGVEVCGTPPQARSGFVPLQQIDPAVPVRVSNRARLQQLVSSQGRVTNQGQDSSHTQARPTEERVRERDHAQDLKQRLEQRLEPRRQFGRRQAKVLRPATP